MQGVIALPAHIPCMSHNAENRNRQPKGRPTGGQFAEEAKSASGIALTGPADDRAAYKALTEEIDRRNGGLATQLSAILSAEQQANHLSIRSHLAAVRPVLAEAGITQVRLDGWWGDPDGAGCYIDEIATTETGGEFIHIEDYSASTEVNAALTHLSDGIAPIDDYAAALGQEMGEPVYLHTIEDPDGLFDEAKLRAEGDELLGQVNRATHVKTFAEPGQRSKWAADQALNALRHGTDLTDPEDDHEVQTAIADALANLRHLATRRGLDFNDAIRVSARYETDDLAEDMGHQSGE